MPARRTPLGRLAPAALLGALALVLGVTVLGNPKAPSVSGAPPPAGTSASAGPEPEAPNPTRPEPDPPPRPSGQAGDDEPVLLSWRRIDPASLEDAGAPLRLGVPEYTVASEDGALLASLTYPSHPADRALLRFVDRRTWRLRGQAEVRGFVAGDRLSRIDGPALLAFAGDALVWLGTGATLGGDVNAHDYAVWRATPDAPEPVEVAALGADEEPWAMALLGDDRLAVATARPGDDPSVAGGVRVLLVDLDAGEIEWTVPLDEVEDGFRASGDDLPERITPGAAWDLDRERLYVAHAHDDGVTVVDLASGHAVAAGGDPTPGLLARLAAWLVPAAHAKVSHGVSRTAALSPDGRTLALSGVRTELERNAAGEITGERQAGLGVRLLDATTLAGTAWLDLPVSDVSFAPDGRLLASGVADGGVVGGDPVQSGLYVVDTARAEVAAHRYDGEIPWVRGYDSSGRRAYVTVGERLEVVDTTTWRAIAARGGAALGLPHLGLLASWPADPTSGTGGRPSGANWPAWPDMAQPTGTVLLFDDGYDGVLAVDLDARRAARRQLQGHRAGDQPHRLVRSGDHLLVGWSSVHAIAIADASSRPLGDATIFVPAAEPGAWLVDYPGGAIGEGTPDYRRVDPRGRVVQQPEGAPDGFPAGGVAGGVALEGHDEVSVWQAGSGRSTRLGDGGFVADTAADTVVWCEADCDSLRVTRLGGATVTVEPPRRHQRFDARSARRSPDGRWVAAIAVGSDGTGEPGPGTVVVADAATGATVAVTGALSPAPSFLGWSPDGSQLFFSTNSYGGSETLVGRYRPADGRLDLAALPFGGAMGFVVLDSDEADAFLAGAFDY